MPQLLPAQAGPPRRHGPAGAAHRGGSERGFVTLELVVLFPVVLLVIFGVIQGALFFHGRNVVLAAAEQGVRAARTDGQSAPAGVATARARQFLLDTGELANFTDLTISPAVTATEVRVTVTARTVSLLPGLPGPQVRASASGPRERFTSQANP